jgi:hypothetical protein
MTNTPPSIHHNWVSVLQDLPTEIKKKKKNKKHI